MKKSLYIALALLLCSTSAEYASAAFTQTGGAGGTVKIDADSVDGAQPVEFNPSTNVIVVGSTTKTAFGVGAYHEQAVGKDSGQAYAMNSETNKMYFMDISADSGNTPPASAAIPTTEDGFTAGSGWNIM